MSILFTRTVYGALHSRVKIGQPCLKHEECLRREQWNSVCQIVDRAASWWSHLFPCFAKKS